MTQNSYNKIAVLTTNSVKIVVEETDAAQEIRDKIYRDLSETALLEKCLHGKTQNQNESCNATIWDRLPKTKFVSISNLEFGVYDTVANFNIGRKASIKIYEKLCMLPRRLFTSKQKKTFGHSTKIVFALNCAVKLPGAKRNKQKMIINIRKETYMQLDHSKLLFCLIVHDSMFLFVCFC